MGTRSLTRVIEDGKPLVCMYRQMDGYPSGHGAELAAFLAPIRVVNGLSLKPEQVANGYGCLAAQMVAHFKEEPGGIYLQPVTTKDAGQEYEYEIHGEFGNPPSAPRVKVYECGRKRKLLFEGTAPEMLQWIAKVQP